jgi:hypothetical protein
MNPTLLLAIIGCVFGAINCAIIVLNWRDKQVDKLSQICIDQQKELDALTKLTTDNKENISVLNNEVKNKTDLLLRLDVKLDKVLDK